MTIRDVTIIELLKKNWYPFGAWPEPGCYGPELGKEMQEKAREIDGPEFERFCARGNGSWREHDMTGRVFLHDVTYRLRSDYQEDPTIEECKIIWHPTKRVWGYDSPFDNSFVTAENACSSPGFRLIGFKFEEGNWYSQPIMPVGPAGKLWSGNITTDDIVSGRVNVLYTTATLFRRQKNE